MVGRRKAIRSRASFRLHAVWQPRRRHQASRCPAEMGNDWVGPQADGFRTALTNAAQMAAGPQLARRNQRRSLIAAMHSGESCALCARIHASRLSTSNNTAKQSLCASSLHSGIPGGAFHLVAFAESNAVMIISAARTKRFIAKSPLLKITRE